MSLPAMFVDSLAAAQLVSGQVCVGGSAPVQQTSGRRKLYVNYNRIAGCCVWLRLQRGVTSGRRCCLLCDIWVLV